MLIAVNHTEVSKVAVETTARPGAEAGHKKARPRSPNYPGIPLEEAIKRARILYQQEQRNFTNVEVILGHWGLKPKSGGGMVELAALIKYGLLVDEGSGLGRRAKLSDAALSILLDAEDSPRRAELIKQAALKPLIHGELWKEYNGSLPSSGSLKHDLIVKRHFTESGASEFIAQFRATVGFAKLSQADKLTGNDQDKNDSKHKPKLQPSGFTATIERPRVTTAAEPKSSEVPPDPLPPVQPQDLVTERLLHVPLAGRAWAVLQVPVPMSEDDWKQMLAVLNAMKPGIVAQAPKLEPLEFGKHA